MGLRRKTQFPVLLLMIALALLLFLLTSSLAALQVLCSSLSVSVPVYRH